MYLKQTRLGHRTRYRYKPQGKMFPGTTLPQAPKLAVTRFVPTVGPNRPSLDVTVAYEVQSSILRLSIVRKSETFLVSNVA
jgi:hypothetical protein